MVQELRLADPGIPLKDDERPLRSGRGTVYVNGRPEELDAAIADELPTLPEGARLAWVSQPPLQLDRYVRWIRL